MVSTSHTSSLQPSSPVPGKQESAPPSGRSPEHRLLEAHEPGGWGGGVNGKGVGSRLGKLVTIVLLADPPLA